MPALLLRLKRRACGVGWGQDAALGWARPINMGACRGCRPLEPGRSQGPFQGPGGLARSTGSEFGRDSVWRWLLGDAHCWVNQGRKARGRSWETPALTCHATHPRHLPPSWIFFNHFASSVTFVPWPRLLHGVGQCPCHLPTHSCSSRNLRL